jgi:Phytanoyl-CoA dioxygenase (PhyH)
MRLFAEQVGCTEGLLFDTDQDGERPRLPQLLDPRNFAPERVKTEFFHHAEPLAKRFLGPRIVSLPTMRRFKPARDGAEKPWHQDDAFRPGDLDCTEVSIWMPLQAVNDKNGCLGFIPGSQKWDVLPHRWLSGDGRIHALGWPQPLGCAAATDPGRSRREKTPCGSAVATHHRRMSVTGAGRWSKSARFWPSASGRNRPRARWHANSREPIPAQTKRMRRSAACRLRAASPNGAKADREPLGQVPVSWIRCRLPEVIYHAIINKSCESRSQNCIV